MSLTQTSFDWVCDVVRRESAIVLEPGKEYLVEARLLPLARAAGADDVSAYVDTLRRDGTDAHHQVVAALTTNETSWFRDITPFRAISEHIVPELVAGGRADRTLRIWSAACSSGQEPFSLVLALRDQLKAAGWKLDILATDINEQMLERARKGHYSQLEINRGLPVTMLVNHFRREGAGWRISDEIREPVRLKRMNLASSFPPTRMFDIVMLRNVLIYFDIDTKRQILGRVRSVVNPAGCLVLGSAETTLGVDESWQRHVIAGAPLHRPVLVAQRKGA